MIPAAVRSAASPIIYSSYVVRFVCKIQESLRKAVDKEGDGESSRDEGSDERRRTPPTTLTAQGPADRNDKRHAGAIPLARGTKVACHKAIACA
jgi:hypothetical protein